MLHSNISILIWINPTITMWVYIFHLFAQAWTSDRKWEKLMLGPLCCPSVRQWTILRPCSASLRKPEALGTSQSREREFPHDFLELSITFRLVYLTAQGRSDSLSLETFTQQPHKAGNLRPVSWCHFLLREFGHLHFLFLSCLLRTLVSRQN